jgi:hypothetical protein
MTTTDPTTTDATPARAPLDLETFLVASYCLVDDLMRDALREALHGARLRARGFAPRLSDSEVIAMEVVGEFLGVETDAGLYAYFRRHWPHLFPALLTPDGAPHDLPPPGGEPLARQGAPLAARAARRAARRPNLRRRLGARPRVPLRQGQAVPPARRRRQLRLRPVAARHHVRAAGAPPRRVARRDRRLRARPRQRPRRRRRAPPARRRARLGARGPRLLAPRPPRGPARRRRGAPRPGAHPARTRRHEKSPWPDWLVDARRRIETVLSQLVERYRAKRAWARDLWHLSSRWLRKVLSHTLAALLCQRRGLGTLRLAQLVAA